ncbi:uncharacterized protein LOC143148436 [Ptiloglossa arizonensis]|uniref:uncharacterized protein LOC143148436 n=1 Tax=Ptiloglossa arizonensis TaxID=3350558 RepID=UPI003F9F1B1A
MDMSKKEQFREALQEMIYNLPPETRAAYEKCLKENVLWNSLSNGVVTGLITYYLASNWSSKNRLLMTTLMSLSGLVIGKTMSTMSCMQKYLPVQDFMRKQTFDGRRSHDKIAEESNVSESFETFETFPEQESQWNIYDNYESSNQYSGTSNVLEEDLSLDKPLNLKQSTTYDNLRKQNRAKYLERISQGYPERKGPIFSPEIKEE